jgi:hypothetical protein
MQPRKDSKAAKKRLKGSQQKTQRQPTKDSKAGNTHNNKWQPRKDSKAGKKRLKGRQEKTQRQARKDSKTGKNIPKEKPQVE